MTETVARVDLDRDLAHHPAPGVRLGQTLGAQEGGSGAVHGRPAPASVAGSASAGCGRGASFAEERLPSLLG